MQVYAEQISLNWIFMKVRAEHTALFL